MKEKTSTIRAEVLDELLQGCSAMPTQEELFGPDGVIKQLSKMLIERCLQAELTTHLGYEKNERAEEEKPNHRNGSSHKTLKSEQGAVEIIIPRDRTGSFDPGHGQEISNELDGLQRENPVAVCAWPLHARYRRPDPGVVWSGGLADAHFQRD